MKIAIVASSFNRIPPGKYGGAEAMIDCLARGLHRAGHDVLLVALEGSTCPVPTRIVDPGSQDHAESPLCKEVSFVLRAYEGLEEFDVVHDHTMLGPVYARAFRDQVPVVVTNHGPYEGVLNEIYTREAPWIAQFLAISRSQARTAPVPAKVIHHGIDADMYAYGEGKGDAEGEYLFFLGRANAVKGPHVAARIAREMGKRLLMAIKVEDPAEHDFFRKEIAPLLGDGVEFIGEVGGNEKLNLIRNASALLNPIQWPEPFGMTMVEALSSGTPVIVNDRGSAREIVEHGVTGFVCNSDEDLRNAVNDIGTIDRRACRASVETYFNMDRMTADHVAVYEEVVAAHTTATNVVDLRMRQRNVQ